MDSGHRRIYRGGLGGVEPPQMSAPTPPEKNPTPPENIPTPPPPQIGSCISIKRRSEGCLRAEIILISTKKFGASPQLEYELVINFLYPKYGRHRIQYT